MILAFSLWLIPFYQDNYSFHFDADDNSRYLFFPVFFCLALFCSVFFFISLQIIKVGGVKVLITSRNDSLETMKIQFIFYFKIVSKRCYLLLTLLDHYDVVIYHQAKGQSICSNSTSLEKFLKHYWLRTDVFQRNRFN